MEQIALQTTWVYDDGGRAAAGFKGDAGDCVARAIAIATGLDYRTVYNALADVNARTHVRRSRSAGKRTAREGIHTSAVAFKQFMESLGWVWTPTMKIGSGCKIHLRADELPAGRLIVAVSKHYVAMIDGVVHDTYDPSRDGTRCVYGYWREARS